MPRQYAYRDADPERQAVLDEMRDRLDESVGLGPNGSGEGLEHGALLLYPHDDLATAISFFRSQYVCALRVMRLYEQLGLEHPLLRKPYARQLGRAVEIARRVPSDYGAWRGVPARKGQGDPPWPRPGFVAIIGGRGGEQPHALSVVDETPDGLTVSVDGGQPDVDGPDPDHIPDGAIQRVTRRFVRNAPGDLRAYTPDGRPGRHVLGLADLAGLVAGVRAGRVAPLRA